MQDYSLIRMKMQANFLNRLLEDSNTPKPKLDYEIMLFCNMIEDFRSSKLKADDSEMRFVYEVLKKAQRMLINKEMEI